MPNLSQVIVVLVVALLLFGSRGLFKFVLGLAKGIRDLNQELSKQGPIMIKSLFAEPTNPKAQSIASDDKTHNRSC